MHPLLPLVPFLFLGAALYASVGHGGATIYLAILTIAGVPIAPLVPTILLWNILAAGIAFVTFRRAGHLRTELLLPLVVTSVPMAYVGGLVPLSGHVQAWVLAVALLAGAARLLLVRPTAQPVAARATAWRWPLSLALGAVLGFLAGTTGIGGGIFLSPALFFLGWATIREAGTVASAFIVVNSLAGLAAKLPLTPVDWPAFGVVAGAVLVGAVAGSHLGARRLPARTLQVLLGVVLLVASVRAVI